MAEPNVKPDPSESVFVEKLKIFNLLYQIATLNVTNRFQEEITEKRWL